MFRWLPQKGSSFSGVDLEGVHRVLLNPPLRLNYFIVMGASIKMNPPKRFEPLSRNPRSTPVFV